MHKMGVKALKWPIRAKKGRFSLWKMCIRDRIEQEVPQWADIERQIGALQAAAARQALADPSSAQTVAEETAQTIAVLRSRQAQLLESEGIDPAALELQFDCPLCRDTGFADAQGRVLCTCAQRRLAELCARDSGLEAFPRHTFKDFDESIFPQGGAQNQRAQMLLSLIHIFQDVFARIRHIQAADDVH